MATWNSRGLRGSQLEDMLNYTNEQYRAKNLALIQKIPTPIKPIRIEKESRHITLAYFDQKSTVDYIGVVQGVPICFDAKETAVMSCPLQNIHEHQVKFMQEFEAQDGIAFIILYFSRLQEAYYVPFRDIYAFWQRGADGGKKSFSYDELDKTYRVRIEGGACLHYLEALQLDLIARDE